METKNAEVLGPYTVLVTTFKQVNGRPEQVPVLVAEWPTEQRARNMAAWFNSAVGQRQCWIKALADEQLGDIDWDIITEYDWHGDGWDSQLQMCLEHGLSTKGDRPEVTSPFRHQLTVTVMQGTAEDAHDTYPELFPDPPELNVEPLDYKQVN